MNRLKLNTLFEIVVSSTLWGLFLYFDAADPFIRIIKENEVWLYKYPVTPSIVPASTLWFIIFSFPIILFGAEFYMTGENNEPLTGAMALIFAYGLNGFVTSLIKNMIGRPRPDFYYRCFPEGVGNDFTKCTGIKQDFLDGRKSFPSGHSSFAFTCMVFMSLYLARKFQLFTGKNKGHSWQLCVCILPILVATGIAISRTCDYHHHYQDVIGGTLLGSTISYMSYKFYFPQTEEE